MFKTVNEQILAMTESQNSATLTDVRTVVAKYFWDIMPAVGAKLNGDIIISGIDSKVIADTIENKILQHVSNVATDIRRDARGWFIVVTKSSVDEHSQCKNSIVVESDNTVAKEILRQINALDRRALMAWGYNNAAFDDDSISFKVNGPKLRYGNISSCDTVI